MNKSTPRGGGWRRLLLCIAVATCSHAASAQAVFKCQEGGQTVFKDHPCSGTQGTVADDMARKELAFKKRMQEEAELKRVQANTPATENMTKQEAVDRMTTYAVVIGRAVACNAPNTQDALARVGAWMDAQGLKKQYLVIFANGVKYAAEQQRDGNTPDPCSKVKTAFASFAWP